MNFSHGSPVGRAGRRIAGLAAAALVASQLVAIPAASAAGLTVTVDRTSIARPTDYFTTVWHNRMDFDDAADFDTTPGRMFQQGSVTMSGGHLQVSGVPQLFVLRGEPGALPTAATRDPRSRPLDGRRFNRISMRLYSDREAAAAFGFRTNCGACGDGAKYFMIRPGWHTYDLDMLGHDELEVTPGGAPAVAGASWNDEITMLWLSAGFNAAAKPQLVFEDFSIHEPAGVVSVQIGGASGPTQLWLDGNGNDADNGTPSGGVTASASYLGTFAANSWVNVPVANFAANLASAQVLAVQSGTARSASVAWSETALPRPRILNAAEDGGADFATTVRGDAWDMSQSTDVATSANIGTWFTNGELRGWPSGRSNDPVVVFDLGARAIDASLFHKLAVTINYEGPFGLEDAPDGGMVARIVWETSTGLQQVSYPIVVEPGKRTYVVDLRTDPREAVVDPDDGHRRVGWGGGEALFVRHLRYDPHEDPGNRAWQIDDVKLLRDEVAGAGYAVNVIDDAWTAGATVDLYADTDRLTTNGVGTQVVAGAPLSAGVNAVAWNGSGVAPGSYWIHAIVRHGAAQAATVSTGQVAVGVFPGDAPLLSSFGAPSAAPSPAVAAPDAQLVAFFTWVLQTKFFCTIARSRNMAAAGKAPVCNLLLGAWNPKKARRR